MILFMFVLAICAGNKGNKGTLINRRRMTLAMSKIIVVVLNTANVIMRFEH